MEVWVWRDSTGGGPLRFAELHVSRSGSPGVFLLPQRRAIPKWHLHEKRPRSQNPGQFLNTWTIVYFHIDSQVSVGLLEVFPKRPLRSEIFWGVYTYEFPLSLCRFHVFSLLNIHTLCMKQSYSVAHRPQHGDGNTQGSPGECRGGVVHLA